MTYATAYVMEFLHSRLNILLESPYSLERVFSFFESHFTIRENVSDEHAITTIVFTQDLTMFEDVDFTDGNDFYIRKSASPFFTIPGKKIERNGREYIYCVKTGSLLALDTKQKRITVMMNGQDPIQEELLLIELIRDLVLKNEENNGVMVVHATCAYKDGESMLIVGPKGAGKSTTLLEFITKFGYLFMSGDKTFLWIENGQLLSSGWPDYPHLGLGTLSKYPELVSAFALQEKIQSAQGDLWSTEHKMAFDFHTFQKIIPHAPKSVISPVGCIIYPQLFASNSCSLEKTLDHVSKLTPHIERMFDKDSVSWNSFILPKNEEKLAQMGQLCVEWITHIPAYELKGSGCIQDISCLNFKTPI